MAHNPPVIVNLNDQVVPQITLTWPDIIQLLKNRQNPWICKSKKAAIESLQKGTMSDFLAFMGGFSVAVTQALSRPIKNPMEVKKDIRDPFEVAIGKYVTWVSHENFVDRCATRDMAWKELLNVLNQDENTLTTVKTAQYRGLTAADKQRVCQTVQNGLLAFFRDVSLGKKEVWLVFVEAFDMHNPDTDRYGPFGKREKWSLEPDDFYQAQIVSSDGTDARFDVPNRLLWAFLQPRA